MARAATRQILSKNASYHTNIYSKTGRHLRQPESGGGKNY